MSTKRYGSSRSDYGSSMSELRIILLLIGAGVIAGVYGWTRYQQSQRRSAVRTSSTNGTDYRIEQDEPDAADIQQQLARMEQLVSDRDSTQDNAIGDISDGSETESTAERLLVISIVAPEDQPFDGESLRKAFLHNKLRFSERGIYERLRLVGGREVPVFGIANLVKPGIFQPGDMTRFSTPGVTLFLQLPCAFNAVEAFDDFVKTAERLAVEVGGELRDERHAVLTHQTLMQVRENIAAAGFYPRAAS